MVFESHQRGRTKSNILFESGSCSFEITQVRLFLFAQTSLCFFYLFILFRFSEAIEDCNQAIRLNPKMAKVYFRRMEAYEELKNDKLALQDCKQWMTLAPKDESARTRFSEIQKRMNDTKKGGIGLSGIQTRPMTKRSYKSSLDNDDGDGKDIAFINKLPHLQSQVMIILCG